jgi:hypothetical protein
VIMAATQSVRGCGRCELFPYLGLRVAFLQASDPLGSVANWPARSPRSKRNGTRA